MASSFQMFWCLKKCWNLRHTRLILILLLEKVIPKETGNRTKARMKETSLTADDNIISEDPDTALELAKSISKTEAEEQEAARLVHETHERLVTKQPTRRIWMTSVTIKDNTTVTKKKTPEQSLKLKGMEMLSDAAIHEEDTRKVIKASKLDLRYQHHTGGSSEGAGSKPEVPDESKGKTKDTNKGAGSKPEVPDVSKAKSSDQESENESWGDSEDDDNDHKSDDERTKSDDNKSIDLNKTDDEEEDQGDEFVHTPDDYVPTDDETHDVDDEEYVCINEELYYDVNLEMKDAEPADEGKEDEEMTDAKKVDADHKEINQEIVSVQVQDEVQTTTTAATVMQTEKTDVPPSSSSFFVSSNYGSIFLNPNNISFAETEIISMSDVQVQQEIPCIQSSSLLTVSVSVIPKPTVIKPPMFVTTAPATNIPPYTPPVIPTYLQLTPPPIPTTSTITTEAPTSTSVNLEFETLSALQHRVSDLEKEVKELKQVDLTTTLRASIRSVVPPAVNEYLGSSLEDAIQKELQKHTKELRQEYSQKSTLEI
ncbi:hypothetical protein Tco_0204722 [Tanacetum coccineum]